MMPHYFKKIGLIISPAGLLLWISGQLGFFDNILSSLNFRIPGIQIILIIGFFSFLTGLYFVTMAKEKKEDEYISKIRLESFQFAAILQFIFFILLFTVILISGTEPNGDSGLLILFIFSVILFWLSYIIRFNLTIHFRNRLMQD